MDDRPEVYRLRNLVHDYNMRELECWLRYDLDAIVFSDDWGSQWQLLIPPRVWRAFFAPCYEEMFARVHEAGKLVFFHSDGYILEVIEDLIALGVDALNSQIWCMGVEELGERFRGRICFWGELDRQYTLPYGTPEDIRAAARKMKQHLETPEGGLIGQGEAGVDVPLENIEAMLSCWHWMQAIELKHKRKYLFSAPNTGTECTKYTRHKNNHWADRTEALKWWRNGWDTIEEP